MADWKSGFWLVLDVETTGLHDHDRIVELGFGVVHQGVLALSGSSLVNPGIPIPEGATAINGIRDADVLGAPTIEQAWSAVLPLLRAADIVAAYNWPFDQRMLANALGRTPEWPPAVDPLVIVRLDAVGRFWKGGGRHRLAAVAERLGVAEPGAHGAACDCRMAARVLLALAEHLPDDGVEAALQVARWRSEQDREHETWRKSQGLA